MYCFSHISLSFTVLQVQVEFSPPTDSRASVVVVGDSVYNLYEPSNPNRLSARRINLETLQFHFHCE